MTENNVETQEETVRSPFSLGGPYRSLLAGVIGIIVMWIGLFGVYPWGPPPDNAGFLRIVFYLGSVLTIYATVTGIKNIKVSQLMQLWLIILAFPTFVAGVSLLDIIF